MVAMSILCSACEHRSNAVSGTIEVDEVHVGPRSSGRVEKIFAQDLESLIEYRSGNPHGARAHPTEEHFLPLFVALGAAPGEGKPERIYDAIDSGVLAMDAYVFN